MNPFEMFGMSQEDYEKAQAAAQAAHERASMQNMEDAQTLWRVMREFSDEQAIAIVNLLRAIQASPSPMMTVSFYDGWLRSQLDMRGICPHCLKDHTVALLEETAPPVEPPAYDPLASDVPGLDKALDQTPLDGIAIRRGAVAVCNYCTDGLVVFTNDDRSDWRKPVPDEVIDVAMSGPCPDCGGTGVLGEA